LEGVRVLDFTRYIAGPYTTRLLADYGAEVIKIQTKRMAVGVESNEENIFFTWNRNKKSITLDLELPEARDLALKLVGLSDIVVENFSPRVMANWQMDYQRLLHVKKQIIMLSMSGMGQTGPWKDKIAFGPTIQALCGLTYMTSHKGEPPMGLGYSYADIVSGLYGALSILAALETRDKTGLGQHIDLSEYESACTMLGPTLMGAFAGSERVVPMGNRSSDVQAAPYGCYRCLGEDRWCVVAVYNEEEWRALLGVLGDPEWGSWKIFESLSAREKHLGTLDQLVGEWMSGQRAEDAADRLQEAGVHAGVVQNAADLAVDPQLEANGFFSSMEHPILGEVPCDTYPIKFNEYEPGSWKPSPKLGDANGYVFGELLGLPEETIDLYVQQGIIS